MKKLFVALAAAALLTGLLPSSGAFARSNAPAVPSREEIVIPSGLLTPDQASVMLANDPALAILDVRTPREFAGGHANGAVNIPVQQLAERLAEVPEGPLLIICRSGKRAEKAWGILISAGRPAEKTWFMKGYTDYENGVPRFHD